MLRITHSRRHEAAAAAVFNSVELAETSAAESAATLATDGADVGGSPPGVENPFHVRCAGHRERSEKHMPSPPSPLS